MRFRRTFSFSMKISTEGNYFGNGQAVSSWILGFFMLLLQLACTDALRAMPDLSKIPTPPTFTHRPNKKTLYFVVEQSSSNFSAQSDQLNEKRFDCQAEGIPPPKYRWLKDQVALNVDHLSVDGRVTKIQNSGSFTINKFLQSDAGTYQCLAENDNGTAVDDVIEFQESLMDLFDPQLPESIQIKFGDPYKKDCKSPRSVPPARSYWVLQSPPDTKPRHFRTINSTNIVVNDKGTIFFQYVTEKDIVPNLYYTCMAENGELKDYKFGSQFTFNVTKTEHRTALEPSIAPIEQYSSPETVTILKGENLELFCVMSGYLDMVPKWSKEGAPLNMSRVTWNTNFNKSMKLYNVTYEDHGTYHCDFDQSPHLSKKFTVKVEDAPFWYNNQPPRSLNSSKDSTVEFNCSAGGIPAPDVKFFKNGQPIVASNEHVTIYGPMLLIKNIKKGSQSSGDNAVYQCEVTNKHGSIRANFYLNILAYPAIILDDPGAVETVVGNEVALKCKVFGSPRPKEKWSNKQPSKGLALHNVKPVDHDGYSQLIFSSARKSDAGEYLCAFKNDHGNDTATRQLIVKDPTVLSVKPRSQLIAAGKRLELPCAASHDPSLPVEYSWLRYGQPVPSGAKTHVDPTTHSLIIDDLTGADTGAYTCVARTSLDTVEETVNITVKDVPLAPLEVRVKCAPTVAEVSFYYADRPTAIAKANSWMVQLNVDPEEPDAWDNYAGVLSSLAGGFGKARVHLHPYGNFAFRVMAHNEVGYSQPAYPTEYSDDNGTGRCATAAQKPPMNPLNVHVKGTTPDNLVVSWDTIPRRDWYGPDFTYVVQYKEKGKGEEEYKNFTVMDPKQDHVVINDLPAYSEYDVVVWSKNSQGVPNITPGRNLGFSGEDLPVTAPEGFVMKKIEGPSIATFIWRPVEPNSVRGEFKGYKIEYWAENRKRDISSKKEAFFDNRATEGSIYDLTPNRKNHARICVHNNAGDGPQSPTIDIDMPEGVPSAVRNLQAFSMSHKQIGVVWEEPMHFNGNLTDYLIEVCVPRHVTCPQSITVKYGHPEEVVVHGLKPETAYRVKVAARTLTGEGELSVADVNTTAEVTDAVPPLEPKLNNVKIGSDHINVTWQPGDYTGKAPIRPPGDEFYFKYRVKGTDVWTTVNESWADGPEKSRLSLSLKNLESGTTYEIKSVSVHRGIPTDSRPYFYTTAGGQSRSSSTGWLIALIVLLILLIILLIIVCLVIRSRGDKYSVSKKEKRQGREPMVKTEKTFGEYVKAPSEPDEEKASLTAEVKLESETDSMAEYGDGENGRFTEDGSFIGLYGPNKNVSFVPKPPPDKNATNNSAVF